MTAVSITLEHRHQFIELLFLFFAVFGCVASAETLPPSPGPQTVLEGVISLHNITGGPVRKGVPDERPLGNTTFVVRRGEETVTDFTTDEQGHFRVSLPPGRYTISKKDWKSRVGFFGPFPVEVTTGQVTKVRWNCETGMQ